MITIYRIENETGEGPYNCTVKPPELLEMIRDHNDSQRKHPSPYEDNYGGTFWSTSVRQAAKNLGIDNPVSKFAFESMYQLNAWFNSEELTLLNTLGFYIKQITLPESHVITLRHQVVYICA